MMFQSAVRLQINMIASTVKSLWRELNFYFENFSFLHFTLIFSTPVLLWHGYLSVELQSETLILSLILFPIYGMAIAAGE